MHRLWLLDNWVCNSISKIGGLCELYFDYHIYPHLSWPHLHPWAQLYASWVVQHTEQNKHRSPFTCQKLRLMV